MTFNILFALVIMPVSIITLAFVCYSIQTKKDEQREMVDQDNQKLLQNFQEESQIGGAK
ncbi:hypothetical protein [Bacillus sp. 22-7]|uniref:hypothetical protein n=1 Tax=Bacillus sp. 22-7 TaxID=2709707 RepID=UPI0013D3A117|nr:hypothetical protein [Bacillus sp. 22-7]